MGVILLFQLTQPFANLWSTTSTNFAIPYWSISIGLNVLVTTMIVGRLYFIRRRTRAVLSNTHSRTYTSIASMLIESAALYTCTALVFLVTYARASNVQNLVLPLLGQVQAVAPLLIMWRVARGQAISRESIAQSGTLSKISWKITGPLTTSGALAGTATAATQSVSLPTFRPNDKYESYNPEIDPTKSMGGDEADSETGWELAERHEHKRQPVEIVVNRQVERWDGTHRVDTGNAV